MARQLQVTLSDDIDGGKAAETVSFAIDGADYEIDLSKKNAAALRKAFAEFVEAARPVRGASKSARRPRRRGTSAADPASVRAWAAENGIKVSERGRIAADVLEQYAAAH